MMCNPEATKENIDESDYIEMKQFSTAKRIINNIRKHRVSQEKDLQFLL